MKSTIFLFFAAFVLHFVTPSSAITKTLANNNTHDFDALLAFKASVFDPQNILPTNWSASIPVCNWIGITCDIRHQRVSAIDLPDMGLVGTIPPQLGNLSVLVLLNVTNNSFHGELPKELGNLRRLKYLSLYLNNFVGGFPIPCWLGALTRLEYLDFRNNKFSGSLSGVVSIANATKLEEIHLSSNFFTGNVPGEFRALQNLKLLALGNNQLRGQIPLSLFNLSSIQAFSFTNNSLSGYLPARICDHDHLPQLQGLYLSYNRFRGEIPSGIGECSKLEILRLSNNNLSGTIPKDTWNLTTLKEMSLGDNYLTGEIPADIGNLHNLEILDIANANMTGAIPHEIGSLNKLEVIAMDLNRFRGPIPEELFNISTLNTISLALTGLSGKIPSTFGVSLPNLKEVYLARNQLTGDILTSMSNASRLTIVDLFENSFSGTIPHSLGDLKFLELLSLSANEFSYESSSRELSFLVSLTNCKRLRTLWISENPLNGYLPISFGNLSDSLESFDASNSGIKGQVPSSIGNLSNLQMVDFVGNSLEGIIPPTIKQLLKIQQIFFGNNYIQGPIPSEFCQLRSLGQLDLSLNNLYGPLPSCLSNMTSLRYLFLNTNNLTSSLPSSLGTLKDILALDLSENSFTGPLPYEVGNLKAVIYMNLSMNQLFGEIPSTIGDLQSIENFSLAHNKLEGLIPKSMKNMLSLHELDLSFNNLGGAIPNSLVALSSLQYFNVSYNKLRGPIPRGGPFVNFTTLSFLSNEALCGAPLLQTCQTFEHRSKILKTLLLVLLPPGFITLALAISYMLMRKMRRKIVAPTHVMFPEIIHERVSFYELQQITNGFSESNLLGSGTFGSVYKGIRANGMIWAIKVFDLKLEFGFKSFDKECEVLSHIRHRNLTKVISACSNPDFKALVLEFMPNGSLEKWLYSNHQILNIMQRLDIMIDVACGLEYLHYGYSTPVVHCDLKPSNILLDQDIVGHICDFGIAKLLGDEKSVVQTNTLATLGYIAPEYGLEGLVSRRCDVYSFGITLLETFTKKKPKDEMFTGNLSLRGWVQKSLPDSVIQVIDVDLLQDELVKKKIPYISSILQLALSCTTNAPEERVNMKDVLRALQKIKFQFFEELKP